MLNDEYICSHLIKCTLAIYIHYRATTAPPPLVETLGNSYDVDGGDDDEDDDDGTPEQYLGSLICTVIG